MTKQISSTLIPEQPVSGFFNQSFSNNQPVYRTLNDLCVRYKKSRATIYRRIADGTIPPGTHFGQGLLWRESDLREAEEKLFGGAGHE